MHLEVAASAYTFLPVTPGIKLLFYSTESLQSPFIQQKLENIEHWSDIPGAFCESDPESTKTDTNKTLRDQMPYLSLSLSILRENTLFHLLPFSFHFKQHTVFSTLKCFHLQSNKNILIFKAFLGSYP